jgi:ketosteroid isomerase-like protein
MDASDLDLERIEPIDRNDETLTPGSQATPMSRVIWGVASGDIAAVEAQIADNIEWGLMPYIKVLKGKEQVMSWLKTGAADQKEPVTITNAATKDWGVFEYWNVGTVSEEVITFGNQQHWPWPKDPSSYLGQKYKVAQCFVYHVNSEGKIDTMRQYLDTQSIWSQLE